jgi:hypothetical protein
VLMATYIAVDLLGAGDSLGTHSHYEKSKVIYPVRSIRNFISVALCRFES